MQKKHGSNDKDLGLGRFESGADSEPIKDRPEYENRVNALPDNERQLSQELSRFADLCQYFEREKVDVPAEIIEELSRASQLPIPRRLEAMKKLNRRLMECLPDVGDASQIRQ